MRSLTAVPIGLIMFLSQVHQTDTYTVTNIPTQTKGKKKRIKVSLSKYWEVAANFVESFYHLVEGSTRGFSVHRIPQARTLDE